MCDIITILGDLYKLYEEIYQAQVTVSQRNVGQRQRSDKTQSNTGLRTRTIRKDNQSEQSNSDRVPQVQLHVSPNQRSSSKPMGTRKRSDLVPGQKVEQPHPQRQTRKRR